MADELDAPIDLEKPESEGLVGPPARMKVTPGAPQGGLPAEASRAADEYQRRIDGLLAELHAEREEKRAARAEAEEAQKEAARRSEVDADLQALYEKWGVDSYAELKQAMAEATPDDPRLATTVGEYGSQGTRYAPYQGPGAAGGAADALDQPVSRRELAELTERFEAVEDSRNMDAAVQKAAEAYPLAGTKGFRAYLNSLDGEDRRLDSYDGIEAVAKEYSEEIAAAQAGQSRSALEAARSAEIARIRGGGSSGQPARPKVNPRNLQEVAEEVAARMEATHSTE